jgi:hypothetical protein
MPVGAIAAVGSVVGGLSQASAARRAGRAQENAAQQELALQTRIYDETTQNFAPFREGGNLGYQAYLSEMGLADAPMIGGTPAQIETFTVPGQPQGAGIGLEGIFNNAIQRSANGEPFALTVPNSQSSQPTTRFRVNGNEFGTMDEAQAFANANRTGGRAFGGFQQAPGTQFALARGMDAINSSGAARGNYLSGANIAGAVEFSQGLQNQEYGNWLNRLQGIGADGQAAAGNQAAAGQAYAQGAGNALAGIGNAQAAGAVGAANAWSGAANNLMGTLGYLNAQNNGSGQGFWGQNIFGGGGGMASSPRPQANPFF